MDRSAVKTVFHDQGLAWILLCGTSDQTAANSKICLDIGIIIAIIDIGVMIGLTNESANASRNFPDISNVGRK